MSLDAGQTADTDCITGVLDAECIPAQLSHFKADTHAGALNQTRSSAALCNCVRFVRARFDKSQFGLLSSSSFRFVPSRFLFVKLHEHTHACKFPSMAAGFRIILLLSSFPLRILFPHRHLASVKPAPASQPTSRPASASSPRAIVCPPPRTAYGIRGAKPSLSRHTISYPNKRARAVCQPTHKWSFVILIRIPARNPFPNTTSFTA